MAEIGSPQSVSALINLFQVRDEKVRYTHYFEEELHPAEIALQKVGSRAIPPLIAALDNENIRYMAAQSLGDRGPEAIPPLTAILQHRIDPAMQEMLQDRGADRRRSAVFALGQIGQKNPASKSTSIKMLSGVMDDRSETLARPLAGSWRFS